MTIREKLCNIQNKLKAPKDQYNSFSNFKFRSCEDILEAVKPLLKENECMLTISDEIVLVGNRYYVKALATLWDYAETGMSGANSISVSAFARETETRVKFDEAQLTGSASTYSRKYALSGLFAIDDSKDSDPDTRDNERKQTDVKPNPYAAKVDEAKKQNNSGLVAGNSVKIETLKTLADFNEYIKGIPAQKLSTEDWKSVWGLLANHAKKFNLVYDKEGKTFKSVTPVNNQVFDQDTGELL